MSIFHQLVTTLAYLRYISLSWVISSEVYSWYYLFNIKLSHLSPSLTEVVQSWYSFQPIWHGSFSIIVFFFTLAALIAFVFGVFQLRYPNMACELLISDVQMIVEQLTTGDVSCRLKFYLYMYSKLHYSTILLPSQLWLVKKLQTILDVLLPTRHQKLSVADVIVNLTTFS